MKKMFFYSVFINLLMGFGFYSHATVSEETLSKLEQEFCEIECVLSPTHLSVARFPYQSNQEEVINNIANHIQGSRPFLAGHSTTPTLSLNWSGYAALTNLDDPKNYSVEKTSGSWIVPTLKSTPNDAFSVAWVGIDGYFDNKTSATVEQIGTAHFWIDGSPVYFAWFEMFGPTSSGGLNEILNFPVNPGDEIFAQVKYLANNIFSLKIYNMTQKVFARIPQSLTFQPLAARTSAEWIIEAPTDSITGDILPLANYGTIKFFNCETVIRHKNGSISNKKWENSAITMVHPNHSVKSKPSSLQKGGKAFNIKWISE